MSDTEFADQLGKFFDFDPKTGKITTKGTGQRQFLLATAAVPMTNSAFVSQLSTGARVIFRELGKTLGQVVAQEAKTVVGSKPTQVTEYLKQFAFAAGWGRFSTSLDSPPKIYVSVRDCVFCEGLKEVKLPNCSFLAGILEGIALKVFAAEYQVIEKKCIAMNDPACEFEGSRK